MSKKNTQERRDDLSLCRDLCTVNLTDVALQGRMEKEAARYVGLVMGEV